MEFIRERGMIHEIDITNFQSLKRLRVRLGQFTVITGRSNTGKSAFIRAVKLLAFNARGTAYVSRGQKTCAVSMSGSDDADTAWAVTVQRGGKDSYQVIDGGLLADGKTFTKLAGKVPEEVTKSLRLGAVNFAGQFDMPYLLDATGSEVARVLGQLTNVTLLYRVAQEANRRRLAADARLRTREADLGVLQQQIAQYATLPAEEAAVESAEAAFGTMQRLAVRRERLVQLLSALQLAQQALGYVAGQALPEPPSLAKLEELAAGRQQLMQRTADMVNAEYRRAQGSQLADGEMKREQQAQRELDEYTAQWGVCALCGQPVRNEHVH